jgi:hypothetical protein
MEINLNEQPDAQIQMSQSPPATPQLHRVQEEDKKIKLVQQSHHVVTSGPVLESGPTSPMLIVSSNPSELERNLDSRLSQPLPIFSTQIRSSHLRNEHSPLSSTWPKSAQSPRPPETRVRDEQNQEPTSQEPEEPELVLEERDMEVPTMTNLLVGTTRHLPDQKVANQRRKENYVNQTCPGAVEREVLPLSTPAASNPQISSGNLTETSSLLNCSLNSHLEHHGVSPCPNGNISSEERPSTSTRSYRRSIALLLIRRERLALEIQKLASAALKRRERSKRARSGLLPGVRHRGQSLSSTNTGNKSWRNMVTTSKGSLQPSVRRPMVKLSSSTKELEMKSGEVKPSYSLTTNISLPCTPPPCRTTGLNTIGDVEEEEESQEARRMKFASVSTGRQDAASPIRPASINMPVWDAATQVTEEQPVPSQSEVEVFGIRPKYLRYNLWSLDSDPKLTVAEWTQRARPLQGPSLSEFANTQACRTITDYPDLFKIVTPVKVAKLRALTASHPNRPFVESVLEGLTNGFWPWADTFSMEGYPITHDESRLLRLSPEKEEFLRQQIQHERDMDRLSASFGKDLLPGMYCMPLYVVPKPHTNSWRLVNDFSAGDFSLNSMVDRQYITGYPLDNLSHLGELLLRRKREKPGIKLVLWKSDVSEAYRICPMHKLWQIKQVVRVQDELSVDRVNVFGGSSSGPIFISVNALAAWVARYERLIESLVYVDDSFGVEEDGKMKFYAPYDQLFPAQQACLLELWDEIGFPHKLRKQIFGSELEVLGIVVDANLLTFSLSEESKDRLSKELLAWSVKGVRKRVKEWQQIAGWLNWVFNVFPLLRPSLNGVYDKLRGKGQEARVWANTTIREDLLWAKARLDESSGVRLFKSTMWEVDEATCVAETDACPLGFAFWYPSLGQGFATSTPRDTPSSQIIFYEALAVLSVLDDARLRFPSGSKIVVYCDNSVTVAMFNSLRALPDYNCILKAAVDILIQKDFQLRVLHIAGDQNSVAEALSRADFMKALHLHPGLTIKTFEPYLRIDRRQLPPRLQPPRQLPLGVVSC